MSKPPAVHQHRDADAEAPIGFKTLSWWRDALAARSEPLQARLIDLYGPDEKQLVERHEALRRLFDGFAQRYGDVQPVAIVRAPGRLNTIGRHVDHRGGYVNPVSLQYDTLMAFARRDDDQIRADDLSRDFHCRKLRIADLLPDVPVTDIPSWLAWTQQLADGRTADGTRTDWVHKLAAAAVYLQHMVCRDRALSGFDGLIAGAVPRAMGLSSSSCIVVVSIEAILAVNDLELPDDEYAQRCGVAEWYVGTRGGCGDHAAIKFGRRDRITHVRTEPTLHVTGYMPCPGGYQLLVFDSRIVADKTGTAGQQFNEKTATYALGEFYLRRWLAYTHHGLYEQLTHERADRPVDRQIYLGDLVEHLDEPALFDLLQQLPRRRTRHELRRDWPDQRDLVESYFATHLEPDSYAIRDVITYGLSECARSARLPDVLHDNDATAYGRLMNISQDGDRVANMDEQVSGRKWSIDPSIPLHEHSGDYHCSLEPLDQMVDIALDSGALGAQVCGAGLGGSVMALVPDEHVSHLAEQMTRRYYQPTNRRPRCLPVQTSAGAGLI